jgi:hypothetical protein
LRVRVDVGSLGLGADNIRPYISGKLQKGANTRPYTRAHENYIAATLRARRDTLRAARFLGMVLPAAFMILLSAARDAAIAAALSPDSIAMIAFFAAVLTEDLRDVLTAFFFAFTSILFLDDL